MKLKKLLFILLTFMSLIHHPVFAWAQEKDPNLVGMATTATVNVRSKPNGMIIASLPAYFSVPVRGKNESGQWLLIELPDGRAGWVSAAVMRVMPSAVPADLVPIMPDNAIHLEKITQLASTLSNGFAFSPDGRLLASYSWKGSVEIYDVRTKILITTLTKHRDIVADVTFSPDGSELASASWDGTVKIWNTQTWVERLTLSGHTDGVNSVAYSPDGKLLASLAQDGLLVIWNPQTSERVRVIDTHSGRLRDMIFSPDGTKIAAAGDAWDSHVHVWNVVTGEELWKRNGIGNLFIAFSPQSSSIVVASGGPLTITGMDSQTARQTFTFAGAGGSAASIALNGTGTLVAAGTWEGTFMLADVDKEQVVFTDASLRGSPDANVILAFSPDGRLLATSDGDHSIYLWGVHQHD